MTFNQNQYVLVDPDGKFYSHNSGYIPATIWDFTEHLDFAMKIDTCEDAMAFKEKITERLYESDGNTNVPKDYLRIGKIQVNII